MEHSPRPDGNRIDHAETDNLEESKFLRREAGEGWHPDGLNCRLLDYLVLREQAIEEMTQSGVHYPSPEDPLNEFYKGISRKIDHIKEVRGIDSPPPIPDKALEEV